MRITHLSIEMPDMMIESEIQSVEESFKQKHAWIPNHPPNTPGYSLNLDSCVDIRPSQAEPAEEFKIMLLAMLADAPLTHMTVWINLSLVGLTFHFVDPMANPSVTLG